MATYNVDLSASCDWLELHYLIPDDLLIELLDE